MSCDQTETSQQHINKHYRDEHGLLSCDTCNKTCNTVSALRKHCYEHSDKVNRYSCWDCNKLFPFESQLKNHCKVHLSALEHHCLLCKKSYKNAGELTKHMNVHSGKTWKCQVANCDYECNDPRNLRGHMHRYENQTWYKCVKCGRGFNFYQQIKCHRLVNCSLK